MTTSTSGRLTSTQWLICAIAAIGFAFDIYEILMLPLIVRPAILELVGAAPGSPEYQMWVGRLFYVPAFAGGIFGLLGGYLTDLFGRRRVLTFSILLYAFAAFASGFATSIGMLLFFRCLVFVGVCVEFVAAVAWVAELFTDPKQREKALGYTQAFSSLGGLLVATANGICVALAPSLPALGAIFGGTIADPHAAWRYTVMSGVLPAIPLIIIRPFLPESPAWERKRAAGTLRRPSIAELFSPELRRTTIVTTLMFAMSYGAAFGAIQQIPQIVPGLPEVKAQTAGRPVPDARRIEQTIASDVTKVQEVGGLVGRTALAYLAVVIVSRRKLLRLFQVPGLIVMPVRVCVGGDDEPLVGLHRNLPRRVLHGRAVQFLGELSAARVPHALTGHGRKLRGKHRRTPVRDVVRVGHGNAGGDAGPRLRADEAGARRGGGRVQRLPGRVRRELFPARAARGRAARVAARAGIFASTSSYACFSNRRNSGSLSAS